MAAAIVLAMVLVRAVALVAVVGVGAVVLPGDASARDARTRILQKKLAPGPDLFPMRGLPGGVMGGRFFVDRLGERASTQTALRDTRALMADLALTGSADVARVAGETKVPRLRFQEAAWFERARLPRRVRQKVAAWRPFSLRTLARWREVEHELGAEAPFTAKVARFRQSLEYREDGRVPTPELVELWREAHPYVMGYRDRHFNAEFYLATPPVPPIVRQQLRDLRGRLPFDRHYVLFVSHAYSDAVSTAEAFMEAGMDPARAVFMTTNYPFHSSVAEQLQHLGILTQDTSLHNVPQAEYEANLERVIGRLVENSRRDGRPILVMEDGGVVTRIVSEKFLGDAHRFKIVERTEAGERVADQIQKRLGRLPFVYWSMARLGLKRDVTSPRVANRVVDRAYVHIAANELTPPTRLAIVIGGGGAMGLPVAKRLRADGFTVRVIEKELDSDPARRAAEAGFEVVLMDEGRALRGAGLVMGMTGEKILQARHLAHAESGAIFLQGSSKRNEFDMDDIEKNLGKVNSPFAPHATAPSYHLGGKTFWFPLDGWTVNHAHTFHGTPMRDLQLEQAAYFESGVRAAMTSPRQAGVVRRLSPLREKDLIELDQATRDRVVDMPSPAGGNPMERLY
jgi:S-adenosylhomocysteine hydrolase